MLVDRSFFKRLFRVFLAAVLVISLSPSFSARAMADEAAQDPSAQTSDTKADDASAKEGAKGDAKSDAKADTKAPAAAAANTKAENTKAADAASTSSSEAAKPDAKVDEKPAAADPEGADAKAGTKSKDEGAVANAKKGNTRAGSSDNTIDNITMVIDAPQAGTRSVTTEAIATSEHVTVLSASFKQFKGHSSDDPSEINFVAGQTYYARIILEADKNYVFKKGESIPNLDIDACDYKYGGSTVAIDGQTNEPWPVDSAAVNSKSTPELLYVWLKVTAVEDDTHKMTFDTRGGSPEPAMQTVADGDYAERPADPKKDSYSFLGWFEKEPADLTKADFSGSNWGGFKFDQTPITKDTTLHAAWYADFEGDMYDVTDPDNPARSSSYSQKGGAASWESSYQYPSNPITQWYSYSTIQESEVTITAHPYDGYEFVCWALSATPTDDEILSTDEVYTFTFDGKMRIYGLFKALQQVFVYYSAGEGKGGTVFAEAVTAGSDVTVRTFDSFSTFKAPEGMHFAGWTGEDGTTISADEIAAGATTTIPQMGTGVTGSYTFTASYEPDTVYLCTSRSDEGGTLEMQASYENEDMEGSNDAYMSNFALPYGAEITLTAIPDDGYRFVGFYEGTRGSSGFVEDYNPDNLLSSSATYTFTMEEDTYVYALFETGITISFDTHGGQPAPDAQGIDKGSKAAKPATDPVKEPFEFRGWFESEYQRTMPAMQPVNFDTKIFDESTTLHAGWSSYFAAMAYDISGAPVGSGTPGRVKVGDGAPVYGYYYPRCPEGFETLIQAQPVDGYRFLGWKTGDNLGEPSGNYISTDTTYQFTNNGTIKYLFAVFAEDVEVTYDANSGTPGVDWKNSEETYVGANLSDLLGATVPGSVPESIVTPPEGQMFDGYIVTDAHGEQQALYQPGDAIDYSINEITNVTYRWKPRPIQVTLTASTIDGSMPVDDYKLEIPWGTSINDLSHAERAAIADYFRADGYYLCDNKLYVLDKPITDYNSQKDMARDTKNHVCLTEETILYVPLLIVVDKIEITFDSPVCGTQIGHPEGTDYWKTQTNPPVMTTPDDAPYRPNDDDSYAAIWVEDDEFRQPYQGTIVGDEDYYVLFTLEALFGYDFDGNGPEVVINNDTGTYISTLELLNEYILCIGTLRSVHVPGDPGEENRVAPTCTEDGSHNEVVHCAGCATKLSSKTITEPALGHDWGEWKTITEPTATEPGLERHVCKRDATHVEEKEIPPLGVAATITYNPNGGSFRGMTAPTSFEYKVGDTVKIAEAPTRDGYTFLYWKGSQYKPGDSYTVKGNHTFTAVWKKNAKKTTPTPKKKAPTKPSKVARTGDTASLWSLIVLLVTSAGVVLFTRRRAQRE